MSDGPIKACWESYYDTVIPSDASGVQVTESKQAFYAGASILYWFLMRALDPGPEPTAADMDRLEGLKDEVDAFAESIDDRYLKKILH